MTVVSANDNNITVSSDDNRANINEYYVSPNGSDEEGIGSLESPFLSINRAVDLADDNSRIILNSGTYSGNSNTNIIIVFSIIMGLLILYNLFKYCRTLLNYKRMAKEDKKALLELLDNNNITREELGNNAVLITNFISQRIDVHHLDPEVYIKYVYLK